MKILDGTISTTFAKCGKIGCHCHENRKNWHGPYYRWTGKYQGKRTTIALTKEQAEECEERIQNYRSIQDELAKLLQKAQLDAPWL